ncbi:MAG TPA: response regulator, partial [Desulfosarcina sp.]|nr:response regulator [Desulfosarcina sp.]
AYGIVKNHGGAITAYSEPGHGTTITIYLPLSQRKAEREKTAPPHPVGGTETVLLVDDEAMILDVGKAMLERLGYRVLTAGGGREAVECLSQQGGTINLVILDMIMPGMDGGETFDRVREIAPAMPVILSSGYSINGQATDIMARGCSGFIQKPFNIGELSNHVRQVLDAGKEPPEGQ